MKRVLVLVILVVLSTVTDALRAVNSDVGDEDRVPTKEEAHALLAKLRSHQLTELKARGWTPDQRPTLFHDEHFKKDEPANEWQAPSEASLALKSKAAAANGGCQVQGINVSTMDVMAQVPIRAAQGLLNSETESAIYYVYQSNRDARWADLLLGGCTITMIQPETIITAALAQFPVIAYDAAHYGQTMMSLVTMAGVLRALPLNQAQMTQYGVNATSVVLDTIALNWTRAEDAVNYTVIHGLQHTTSVAFLNLSTAKDVTQVDFVISRKLFVQYLSNCCVPKTEHNKIFVDLVSQAPWPRPIKGYGYNGQDFFLGYIYEANTNCIDTMGEICTMDTRNLGFWTYFGEPLTLEKKLIQLPSPKLTYEPKKKAYVGLVYGDMDNMLFVQTIGREHMDYRRKMCSGPNKTGTCFPFTWTLSPNLIEVAPEMMRWYFESGASTEKDWFIFPPSGTMYGYPSWMPHASRMGFIERQTKQSIIMNTSGSVDWEWFYSWSTAFENYFPHYVGMQNSTRNFFLNDVPWVIPIPELLFEDYTTFGFNTSSHPVFAFKPAFGWQTIISGGGGIAFTPAQCAGVINAFPEGATVYIYVIQNTPIEDVFKMVSLINRTKIELVGYEQLADLAHQKETMKRAAAGGGGGGN